MDIEGVFHVQELDKQKEVQKENERGGKEMKKKDYMILIMGDLNAKHDQLLVHSQQKKTNTKTSKCCWAPISSS